MSRIVGKYVNKDGKTVEIRKRIIPFEFDVTERNTKTYFRKKLPNSIKKIIGAQIIPHDKDVPIRASKRYWSINSNPTIITTASTDVAIQNFIQNVADNEDIVSKSKLIEMETVLPDKVQTPVYATPIDFGQAQLLINESQGQFAAPKRISITDPETGFVEDYFVYFTVNPVNLQKIILSVL